MKLSDLFTNGSIVSLHLSLWRARTKIVPADLGITDTSDVRQALVLGTHRLADPKAFEDVLAPAREARATIERNSLSFEMIPGARYVPAERLEEVAAALKNLRTAFYAAVDDFCSRYESIKAEQLPKIRSALEAAARDKLRAEDAFNRILAEYPDVEDVKRRFSLRWQVYTLRSVDRGKLGELFDEEGEVKSVVRGMVDGLRGEVTGRLTAVLDLLARGGRITKRTITSAIETLDRIESLNVVGDSGLEAQIRSARDVLRSVTPETGDEVVVNGLSTVTTALQQDIEAAVLEAERNLTGYGRRKIAI